MMTNTQYLWTPWRMSYVSGKPSEDAQSPDAPLDDTAPGATNRHADESERPPEGTGCVFCDRIRLPETYDRGSLILLRSTHNFVILNLYPYNSAHLMVVPYNHTSDLVGLDTDTTNEMMELVQRMVQAISEEYNPEGFNIGMNLGRVAGAGVADHLHMHVVPRWAGDTNFMPIVGATKVMPELLETTYDRLKARLQRV
jgi:ATP adenylyltransferase